MQTGAVAGSGVFESQLADVLSEQAEQEKSPVHAAVLNSVACAYHDFAKELSTQSGLAFTIPDALDDWAGRTAMMQSVLRVSSTLCSMTGVLS